MFRAMAACLSCVFPSSQGRFFEFEDRGPLIGAVAHKIDSGEIQMFCVDSVDAESWYNRDVPPRWRIARHVQYESYIMEEVLPFIRLRNFRPASRFCRLQLRRLSRRQHRALRHPDPLYGIPLYERAHST